MLEHEIAEELVNLRLAAVRFEQLFQGLPLPCIGMDLFGTIYDCNRSGEQALGRDSQGLFMANAFTVLCSNEEQRARMSEMLEGIAAGKVYESFEWELRSATHDQRFLLCNMLPKPGPGGVVLGAIFAGIDMTAQKAYEMQIEEQLRQIHDYSVQIEQSKSELEDANRRLEDLASIDGLTGILNRRAFFDVLKEITGTGRRPVSLIMLDVDNFKDYNDSFGHPEGDAVLRTVAESLASATRTGDVVARYGGEEFVVLLPGACSVAAFGVASRMRLAVQSASWQLRPVTASFGVATWHRNSTVELLVEEADAALYMSKRNGKNCVTVGGSKPRKAA